MRGGGFPGCKVGRPCAPPRKFEDDVPHVPPLKYPAPFFERLLGVSRCYVLYPIGKRNDQWILSSVKYLWHVV